MLTTSKNGIELIKKFEGCRLSAYTDAAGVITIGYGWTKAVDGKPLTLETKITKSKAESLLKKGLKTYEAAVNKYHSKYSWNQNQFDALVSFAYNTGSIAQLTANGTRSIDKIAEKMPSYCKAGGKVLSGLKKRREAEQKLFLTPVSPKNTSHSLSYYHKKFVKDVQNAIGAKADGIPGNETLSKTVTVSKRINSRHAVVKPIQIYLNALGINCGKADGIAGTKFDAAVKKYQKSHGCIADGELTACKNTWKKLLFTIP